MSAVHEIIGHLVATRIYVAEGCYDEESIMSLTGCSRKFAEDIRDMLEQHDKNHEKLNKDIAA